MIHILAELAPLKISDGSRPVLRASSAQDRKLNGVTGQKWWPAIAKRPTLSIPLFDGDFTQDVAPGTASFAVRLDGLEILDADARGYRWPGAAVSLYTIDSSTALNTAGSFDVASLDAVRIFKGRVDGFGLDGNALTITAEVDQEPFNKDVLRFTYAGTGDDEGGEDLKGRLKPWIFGRALNVEPILINSVDNVVQFSAYAVEGISALYERGASFGPSIGNYASYEELVAAKIPAGRWATCHARGMARLGAPPYGVITGDIDGDNASGFIRKTGQIIRRVALDAGVTVDLLDAASLDALDAAVPYPINLVLTDQISILDLARRLARPCNAQAGLDLLGRLFAVRPTIGTPAVTLDAQGRRLPPVRRCQEAEVSAPYKRIMFGANRSWRVHTFDEIAFDAELVDRGDYDPTKTYRRGNIVSLPNGSRWLYVSDTPKAGSYPSEDNPEWELMTGPITAGNINYEDGTSIEDLKPATPGATAGAPSGTVVGDLTVDDIVDALKAIALTSDPAEVLAGAKAFADSIKQLTMTADPSQIVDGAKALVDRVRSADMAALEQLVLNQNRKERLDDLTHMDGVAVSARVRSEIVERVEADLALAQQITDLEAVMELADETLAATIHDEQLARVDADEALAQSIETVVASVDTLDDTLTAAVANEAIARADGDSAEAEARQLVIARVDGDIADTNAAISDEAVARANAVSAETQARELAISEVEGDIGDVSAALAAEAITRADQDSAEVEAREAAIASVQGDVNDVTAALAAEVIARADADSAEVEARESAVASVQDDVNDVSAALTAEIIARANADSAETEARELAISQVQGDVGDVSAAIAAEAITRADADSAETIARNLAISEVQDGVDDVSAAIAAEAITRANADSAEVTARDAAIAAMGSSLSDDIDDVIASVITETNARVDADSALAELVTGVESTLDGHTASITMLSASVDGILAKWGLNLNSNGHIIGILANNDGDMGGFDIVADWLRIWDASGLHSQAVFDYSGGVLKMLDVEVDTIRAGSGNSAQFGGAKATSSVAGTGSPVTVLKKTIKLLQPGAIHAQAALALQYSSGAALGNYSLFIGGQNVFSVGGNTAEISVILAGYRVLDAGTYDVEIVFNAPSSISVVGRNVSTTIIYAGTVMFDFMAGGGSLDADAALSRASGATYMTASFGVATAASGVPRFTYNSAGALAGLLVEPAATNLFLQSDDIANAAWTAVGVSASSTRILEEDTSTGTHGVSQQTAYTAGKTYTISAIVSEVSGSPKRYFMINLSSTPFGSSIYAKFDAATGAITTPPVGATAGSQYLGNNRWLFWITATATAAGNGSTNFRLHSSSSAGSATYTGTTGKLSIGLRQIEEGSKPTARIGTSSVAVTRAADVLTLNWEGRNVPDGTATVRYTFDDGSTQDVLTPISGGVSIVPTNLNRPVIRAIAKV